MSKKSGMLQQIAYEKKILLLANSDTQRQFMIDMMCIVLNDSKVMGKDVFGKTRLLKIATALNECYQEYKDAIYDSVESDVRQRRLDDKLRQIFGEDLVPFNIRYEYVKSKL